MSLDETSVLWCNFAYLLQHEWWLGQYLMLQTLWKRWKSIYLVLIYYLASLAFVHLSFLLRLACLCSLRNRSRETFGIAIIRFDGNLRVESKLMFYLLESGTAFILWKGLSNGFLLLTAVCTGRYNFQLIKSFSNIRKTYSIGVRVCWCIPLIMAQWEHHGILGHLFLDRWLLLVNVFIADPWASIKNNVLHI